MARLLLPVMDFSGLPGRLATVREAVARVQAQGGLSHPVRIVAITKGHPPEAVIAALRAGLPDVGENRVQDALRKQEELATVPVTWHLVGHLQTNKAKQVAGRFAWVQSVDSQRVATALAMAARSVHERGGRIKVLLQVNVAGESQKNGCDPDAAGPLAHGIAAMPELELRGLMTLAPLTDDERVQHHVFAGLRRLRDRLTAEGLSLPELSMGMSADYRAAVAEGATMLRLGTVLFGERTT